MQYLFTPPAVVSVPVVGHTEQYPVHRIYCVGRNYEEHAKEMGFTGREPPFFFLNQQMHWFLHQVDKRSTCPTPA